MSKTKKNIFIFVTVLLLLLLGAMAIFLTIEKENTFILNLYDYSNYEFKEMSIKIDNNISSLNNFSFNFNENKDEEKSGTFYYDDFNFSLNILNNKIIVDTINFEKYLRSKHNLNIYLPNEDYISIPGKKYLKEELNLLELRNIITENIKKENIIKKENMSTFNEESKENIKKEISKNLNLDIKLFEIEFTNEEVSENEFKEIINININEYFIKIESNIKRLEGFSIIKNEFYEIDSFDKFIEVDDEPEEKFDIDKFHEEKYPNAYKLKTTLNELGYRNNKISTSVKTVEIYGSRDSTSSTINNQILDEAEIILKNDEFYSLNIVKVFTQKDYETYRDLIISNILNEIKLLSGKSSTIDINSIYGEFENIDKNSESYVEIDMVELETSDNLVVINILIY